MPVRSQDLHGSVPDNATVALLLIDVINDLDFPGSEALLAQAVPMAKRIRELKKRAKALGIPSVYVNDNFGKWQSDFRKLLRHCLNDDVVGRPMVEILQPDPDDYFVLKPKHSGFYSTNLEVLLEHLHADTLILTGVAGNICVLFTANDAYMRDYRLLIPSDCTASNTAEENQHALQLMQRVLKADITPSNRLDLAIELKRLAS
jgi:nicotinamidase-related amidase